MVLLTIGIISIIILSLIIVIQQRLAWTDEDRNGKQVDVDTSSSDKRISNLKVSSVDNVQVDIRTTITTSSITTVYLETTIT
jgi:hypothetical protein